MKRSMIMTFMLLTWGIAPCQYSWYNNLYGAPPVIGGSKKIHHSNDTIQYFGWSAWLDDQNHYRSGLVMYRVNLSSGQFIDVLIKPYTDNEIAIAPWQSWNSFSQLNDGNWLVFAGQNSDCGMAIPQIVHLNAQFDTISVASLNGLNDCIPYKDYYGDGMVVLNDDEYLITTRVDYAFDSSGHYFTRLNLAGDILDQDLHVYSTLDLAKSFVGMEKYGADSLIIWGNGADVPDNYGVFLQKTDLQGNVSDFILLNDDINSFYEGSGSGRINNEDDMIFFQQEATYYNGNQGYGDFQLWAKRIDLASMTVQQNAQINIPEIADTTYWNIPIHKVIKAQDEGYLILATAGNMTSHGLLIKVNEQLELEWYHFYSPPGLVVNDNPYFIDIEPTPDGGYVIGGMYVEALGSPHWIIKIDNCGYEVENGCPEFVSVEEHATIVEMQLWPNPASDYVNVDLEGISNVRLSTLNIQVFDITGLKVLGQQVKNVTQMQLDVSSLATGMYIVEVDFGDGQKTMQKLMVE